MEGNGVIPVPVQLRNSIPLTVFLVTALIDKDYVYSYKLALITITTIKLFDNLNDSVEDEE